MQESYSISCKENIIHFDSFVEKQILRLFAHTKSLNKKVNKISTGRPSINLINCLQGAGNLLEIPLFNTYLHEVKGTQNKYQAL